MFFGENHTMVQNFPGEGSGGKWRRVGEGWRVEEGYRGSGED